MDEKLSFFKTSTLFKYSAGYIIYNLYTLHQNNAHFPRGFTGSCIYPAAACLFTFFFKQTAQVH